MNIVCTIRMVLTWSMIVLLSHSSHCLLSLPIVMVYRSGPLFIGSILELSKLLLLCTLFRTTDVRKALLLRAHLLA